MNLSKKHHYIPEFFLKGFANEDKKLHIYNSKTGKIKKNSYPPSTHFYEEHRNSITVKENTFDLPEKGYSVKENRYSKIISKFQDRDGIPELETIEMLQLQEFVSNLFWRLPINDELFKKEFKGNPLFMNSYKIKDIKSGIKVKNEKTDTLTNSEPFIKAMRVTASDFSLLNDKKEDMYNWRFAYTPGGFNICSDNPFIIRDNNCKCIFDSEFILPLTKNHLLIRTFKYLTTDKLEPQFGFLTNLSILKQSKEYTASSRKDFLETLSENINRFELDKLKFNVFNMLDECTED